MSIRVQARRYSKLYGPTDESLQRNARVGSTFFPEFLVRRRTVWNSVRRYDGRIRLVCSMAAEGQSWVRGILVLALLVAASTNHQCEPGAVTLEFTDVRDDFVVHPFGFRFRNAPCRGKAGEEACRKYRDVEKEREHLTVAILVLVDERPFHLFTLNPQNTRLPVHEEVVQYDDTFFKNLHFADNSSDPLGFVDVHLLAPGEYTIVLKLIHPDAIGYGRPHGSYKIVWYADQVQLLGVDSEPRLLRIEHSVGLLWAEDGLLEATHTAALWSHFAGTACLEHFPAPARYDERACSCFCVLRCILSVAVCVCVCGRNPLLTAYTVHKARASDRGGGGQRPHGKVARIRLQPP